MRNVAHQIGETESYIHDENVFVVRNLIVGKFREKEEIRRANK